MPVGYRHNIHVDAAGDENPPHDSSKPCGYAPT
jgi:hypothetical protein